MKTKDRELILSTIIERLYNNYKYISKLVPMNSPEIEEVFNNTELLYKEYSNLGDDDV